MQGSHTGKIKIPLSPLAGAFALGIAAESPELARTCSGKPDRNGNAQNILFILLHKQMYIQAVTCFVLEIDQVRNNVRSDSHLIKPAC